MHELSIVMSIVDIANKEAEKHHAPVVESIELHIGKLSGIEPDAFDFAWQVAVKGTVLEKTERIIRYIPGIALCLDCGTEFSIESPIDGCPECNSFRKDYKCGRELRVLTMTVQKE